MSEAKSNVLTSFDRYKYFAISIVPEISLPSGPSGISSREPSLATA